MYLRLIKGTIRDLQVAKSYEDFIFSSSGKNAIGVAAIGAAAMEQFFDSSDYQGI